LPALRHAEKPTVFAAERDLPADASISLAAAPEAERRQLTVMFCDLVGSTALSTGMDPEDLRDVIASYQNRCGAAIRRYDGFVAKYMGDGILAYFGYPRANEDEAERSARAGLDIVDAMAELNAAIRRPAGVELAVRIGTGDRRGSDRRRHRIGNRGRRRDPEPGGAAAGPAQPNQIVVSSATRAMLGDHFDLLCRPFGVGRGVAEGVEGHAFLDQSKRSAERAVEMGGAHSSALMMSSHIFLASPNSIIVLSR
jgi:class 3 adenylate cyclase